MAGPGFFKCVKNARSLLAVLLVFCGPLAVQANAADVVTTYKDEKGWKLQVNGKDFYVKAVVSDSPQML